MNKTHLITLATTVLLAISGVATGGAQAAPYGPALPLGPAGRGQLPLSPLSQQQAVRAAKDYLDYTAFSYQGLIKQLVVGDGYSTADATSAVNSITVDWNEQAAQAAQQYLDYTSFSHSGLINQLTTGDGYTPAQAAYGVSAVGL
jgi:uncharacterized protein YdeI (BOF family)